MVQAHSGIKIYEDLSPAERELKKSRTSRFLEELEVPKQWVQWRRAEIYICQAYDSASVGSSNAEGNVRSWHKLVNYSK